MMTRLRHLCLSVVLVASVASVAAPAGAQLVDWVGHRSADEPAAKPEPAKEPTREKAAPVEPEARPDRVLP